MPAESQPAARKRKHRHDTGDPDHGPVTTVRVTTIIQFVLASAIMLTGGLVLYATLSAGR